MHEQAITEAFSRQAESFSRSALANSDQLLDQIVELAAPERHERWLDAACGPGIIARRLAPLVSAVDGVDATPAMIEIARREAASQAQANVRFHTGDITRLPVAPGTYDGFVTRFSLHHIPLPHRVLEEAARVLRPGGRAVIVDHLADDDADSFAWSQEVERLRDPSHWMSLSLKAARRLGEANGLRMSAERILTMELDFHDWLERGAPGREAADLVHRRVAERPGGTDCFRLDGDILQLRIWISAWEKPAPGS